MSDSDDYGDELNDTLFLDAATQVEKENTPAFQASPRPTKRRKIGQGHGTVAVESRNQKQTRRRRAFVSSDEDDVDNQTDHTVSDIGSDGGQPARDRNTSRPNRARSKQYDLDDTDDDDASPARETAAQKRKNLIHVPTTNLQLNDMFFTQPPQEHSPPWKPRGAIWAKQTTIIGIHKPAEPSKQRPQPPLSPAKSISPPTHQESPQLPRAGVIAPEYDYAQDLADLPSDAFASSSSSPQKQDDVIVTGETRKRVVAPQTGLRQTTLFGRQGPDGEMPPSQINKRYNFVVDQKREPPTHHKLDPEAIKTWVYPTNLGTIRDYQFNIVQRGLYHNLLVALPTGLGKTFIAATIMLNWFRWTKDAQIVFVAPTKPLVSQQVEACYNIAGIPRSYTTMLIGGVPPALRSEEWQSKRVFFMTPQTLLNDLKHGYADPKKIVLLVVDEAHRATGAYAYVEVVSFLRRFNESFRVLALTATPGADVEAVQKVIDGLDISRVEIRTENSMDICSYVHQRRIEKQVFKNSDEMEMCMELYSQALQPLVSKVAGLNAYWSNNPLDLTPFGCQQARKKYFMDAGRNANQGVKAIVNSVFSILGSVSHAMDLLKYHGMGPFYIKLRDFREESEKTKSKYKKQVLESEAFKKLMIRLEGWVTDDEFVGHPKLEYLQEVILDHFVNAGNGDVAGGAPPSQTRIMVFAHFRDSAEEISRILKRHHPMIRPRVFLGQASGKNSEGMSQKEQLEVIEKFKMGTYNTLIATSIGEEGLDIGEVDLIICYDSKASPIRMLQRMGRTGRKREGRIVMLQMEGKEENDANKAKDSYEKMQEIIANGSHFTFHDEISRRILPPDVRPVVDRRVVEIPPENSQMDFLPEPKKKGRMKKPPKVFHMPDNVLTGFVTAGNMDEEIKPKGRGKKTPAPVYPSEELQDIPSLESVLLDAIATKDLNRRFQTVYDDDDAPMINGLDYGRHSGHQRVLSKPKLYSAPGRGARDFVDMMQRVTGMDTEQLDRFKKNVNIADCAHDIDDERLVSDTETRPHITEDMWASEEETVPEALPQPKAKPKAAPKPKAKPAQKEPAPRGRPRKSAATADTPVRPTATNDDTPLTKTPTWRMSALAAEGEESSPPPSDPRFRIASQADTIGSDDTVGADEPQDTQAYKMDSELASFIVEDDEEIDIPPSSLPSLNMSGLGSGTQALMQAAKSRRPPRAEKLFTSDPTDDDAVVSSDSDDDEQIVKSKAGTNRNGAVVLDSDSEGAEPVAKMKRARRVIEDDDDDE